MRSLEKYSNASSVSSYEHLVLRLSQKLPVSRKRVTTNPETNDLFCNFEFQNFFSKFGSEVDRSTRIVPSSAPHSTSPILRIRTRHITAVYINPQTLNNFNFHYFIIIHYPILLLLLLLFKTKILTEIIFVSYYGVTVTQLTTFVVLYQKKYP